jgi:hypothetical protein
MVEEHEYVFGELGYVVIGYGTYWAVKGIV